MGEVKTCSKCMVTKPVANFYKKRKSYSSWCKICQKQYNKEWKIKSGITKQIGTGNNNTVYSKLSLKRDARKMMFDMQQEGMTLNDIGIAFGSFVDDKFVPMNRGSVSNRISDYLTTVMYEQSQTISDITP